MDSIIIAGGSGLVGSRLVEKLTDSNCIVNVLTRSKKKSSHEGYIFWDPSTQKMGEWPDHVNHVINLAGAGIADKRWTKERKKLLLSSRLDSTNFLIQFLRENNKQLDSYIAASAIGYYGDGGHSLLREEMQPVSIEFLSDVCVKWEEASSAAKNVANQMNILRIGTVLSTKGGALPKMGQTIPLGVANYLGNGKQMISWIHIDDLCKMILYLIQKNISGIYNAVAPDPIDNKSFTIILKDIINPRAIVLPAPSNGIKLAFGELSRLVLNSSNVSAEKIQNEGFVYDYPSLTQALKHLYQEGI